MPDATNPLSSFVVPNSDQTHYTPTTAEIRDYVEVGGEPRPWADPDDPKDALRAAAFDRWLAAHDREIKAEVLREFGDRLAVSIGRHSGEDVKAYAYSAALHIEQIGEDQ